MNVHVKYIAHARRTCSFLIHDAVPCPGFQEVVAPAHQLRFNHYWGARVQKQNAERWSGRARVLTALRSIIVVTKCEYIAGLPIPL